MLAVVLSRGLTKILHVHGEVDHFKREKIGEHDDERRQGVAKEDGHGMTIE